MGIPNTLQPNIAAPPGRRISRALISALLAVHLCAVFTGPWAMPPAGSLLSRSIASALGPYVQAMYLDNGYRFFAPEPGPSHLIRYEAVLPDGKLVEGFFPDRTRHWPRLLYHRYFMLSEFVSTLDGPGVPPELVERYAASYAKHLAHEYGAKQVTLYLRTHNIPDIGDVRRGKKLDDPSLYEEKLLGTYEEDQP